MTKLFPYLCTFPFLMLLSFQSNGLPAWGHALVLGSGLTTGDDPLLLFSYRNKSKYWSLGGQTNKPRFSIWEDGRDSNFGSSFGTERLAVLAGGNVGIGINNPAEKLAVNGTIRAKEIKVENQNRPDYVSVGEYKKHSLAEIEGFIKSITIYRKSHLHWK